MYWFKQCPRCSGDLVVENDRYGIFVSCMQCGMCKDVASEERSTRRNSAWSPCQPR